jgi:hypothetical protein
MVYLSGEPRPISQRTKLFLLRMFESLIDRIE